MTWNKKSAFAFAGPVCAMLLLAGCAWGKENVMPDGQGNIPKNPSGQEESIADAGRESAAEGDSTGEDSADFGEEEENAGGSGNPGEENRADAPRDLTSEELEQFTDFVNRKENNGFLTVPFAGPEELDLNEVFYNGAGMEEEPLTEEEREKYEEACLPIETDITRLTGTQINAFLERKAGITMENVTKKLDWFYMEESDSYIFQHGDTNYCFFICTGGKYLGENIYEIHCSVSEEYVIDDMERVVTLRKNGEDYQFISSVLSM